MKTKEWKCLNAHSLQGVLGLFLWRCHEYCPVCEEACGWWTWLRFYTWCYLELSCYWDLQGYGAFLCHPLSKDPYLTSRFMSKYTHMMLPMSAFQHSISTRFTSLQQREAHCSKFCPSLWHLHQSIQLASPWLNAYKSVYYYLLPTKRNDCCAILQLCLFCFPLWKETCKCKLLDQRCRRNKAGQQWHIFNTSI